MRHRTSCRPWIAHRATSSRATSSWRRAGGFGSRIRSCPEENIYLVNNPCLRLSDAVRLHFAAARVSATTKLTTRWTGEGGHDVHGERDGS
ncbi:hypothetical protein I546_2548 [Mycobacterium kansasii 732]|nr:hypothetical protein I546_2548 [Mycobacterium kansasii 732]